MITRKFLVAILATILPILVGTLLLLVISCVSRSEEPTLKASPSPIRPAQATEPTAVPTTTPTPYPPNWAEFEIVLKETGWKIPCRSFKIIDLCSHYKLPEYHPVYLTKDVKDIRELDFTSTDPDKGVRDWEITDLNGVTTQHKWQFFTFHDRGEHIPGLGISFILGHGESGDGDLYDVVKCYEDSEGWGASEIHLWDVDKIVRIN